LNKTSARELLDAGVLYTLAQISCLSELSVALPAISVLSAIATHDKTIFCQTSDDAPDQLHPKLSLLVQHLVALIKVPPSDTAHAHTGLAAYDTLQANPPVAGSAAAAAALRLLQHVADAAFPPSTLSAIAATAAQRPALAAELRAVRPLDAILGRIASLQHDPAATPAGIQVPGRRSLRGYGTGTRRSRAFELKWRLSLGGGEGVKA
jgi:hypothetical protein